jgi:hypothetical protein
MTRHLSAPGAKSFVLNVRISMPTLKTLQDEAGARGIGVATVAREIIEESFRPITAPELSLLRARLIGLKYLLDHKKKESV